MQDQDSRIAEVFTFWRDLLAPRAKLDERRRRLIRARLDDGYTAEELKLAALGCRASPFHQGDNDRAQRYCSIDLICRNAEKVDQFIEIAESEAAKMSRRAAARAAEDDSPAVPMPDSVRAKLQLLLGRYSSKPAATRANAGNPAPNAALAD